MRRTRRCRCRYRCRPKAARSKACPWLNKLLATLQGAATAHCDACRAFAHVGWSEDADDGWSRASRHRAACFCTAVLDGGCRERLLS